MMCRCGAVHPSELAYNRAMMNEEQTQEMFQMVRDNNKMLHAMRRSHVVGSFFKVIFYVVFVIIPLLYSIKYLAPMLQPFLNTAKQMQGGNSANQIDMSKLADYVKQFEAMLPKSGTTTQK